MFTELLDLIKQGQLLMATRLAKSPSFGPYTSVDKQLQFLAAAYQAGTKPSWEDKKRLTIGVLAAREFEDSDPELADLLFKLDHAVDTKG